MSEFRRDPVSGRWVIVAKNRARRPGVFFTPEETKEISECPFCEHHEAESGQEIYSIREENSEKNGPGWQVRVVPSRNPIFKIEGNLNRRGHGLYDEMDDIGAHEVVVETPRHIANMADLEAAQIEKVLYTYTVRINDLEKDPRFKYVLAYKSYGQPDAMESAQIRHSRSYLIAMPVNPMMVKEELVGARKYFDFHDRCLFCDMIRQECELRERVVAENDEFVALIPFSSRFPFETWILPKRHNCDFAGGEPRLHQDMALILKDVLLKLKNGLQDPAYDFVIHSAPFRREHEKGQKWKTIEEDFHWHMEILPRLTRVAGFERGTDFYICSIPPEDTAEFLRGVS